MDENLIAPCGMNCSLCFAYQADKYNLKKQGINRKYCPGCIPRGQNCLHMGDRCEALKVGKIRYCYTCASFPCKRLKALDKRYSTKYNMSMIENLVFIKTYGTAKFFAKEKEKWSCPSCGELICCHSGSCLNCNLEKLKKNKKSK